MRSTSPLLLPSPGFTSPAALLPATPKSTTLTTSTTSNINNIWSNSSTNSLSFSRFYGLAKNGLGTYDSSSGLPARYVNSGEFKSPTVLGFGVGAGGSLSALAGVDLKVNASTGAANLKLNDQIKFTWTKDATNFILSSSYLYNPSQLTVTGPTATATVTGKGDFNANVYLLGTAPGTSWRKVWEKSFANTNTLFSKTFGSTQNQSISFLNNTVSLNYEGINLNTASNTQITNGVRSSVTDPVLSATLDLDRAIGSFIGLPTGLTASTSLNVLGIKLGGSLTLADIALKLGGSIKQDITTKVDSVTGVLTVDGKTKVNYKIGDSLKLPISTFDLNKDGKLDISGIFTKNGTISNKTDFLASATADLKALAGGISASVNLPIVGNKTVYSGGFGPLLSTSLTSPSVSFNVYDKSWAAPLGTTSAQTFTLT